MTDSFRYNCFVGVLSQNLAYFEMVKKLNDNFPVVNTDKEIFTVEF